MAELNEQSVEQALGEMRTAQEAGNPLVVQANHAVILPDGPFIAFYKQCELLNASWSLDSGRTVEFRITGESFDRLHPFKRFTQRRGGRAGTRFIAAIGVNGTGEAFYHSEVMLAAWGDNSTHGQHFKLWLDDEAERHPFAGFNRRKGHDLGDLFIVALVELDDDNTAINQIDRTKLESATSGEPRPGKKPRSAAAVQTGAAGEAQKPAHKPRKLSSQAHVLVRERKVAFVRYLNETKPGLVKEWTPLVAEKYVKSLLKVESFSQLDSDREAAQRYHDLVRRPYEKWFYQDPGDHP